MKNPIFVFFSTAALAGCASWPVWGESAPASPEEGTRQPAPVALSASPALDDARPRAAETSVWPEHEDGLSLKRTELYPDLGIGDKMFRIEQQSALAGDKDAAVRVARMFQRGTNSVPRDEKKMVQWLRRASDLKHAAASYELYLYYVERGLDREAVRYEKRALEQGFTPPPRLDPRRG